MTPGGARSGRRVVVVVIGVLAALVSGCSSKNEPSTTSTAHALSLEDQLTLSPVTLPDLAPTATSVQTQVRDQYALLTRIMQNPAAPASDLARAYGELGKLLMAGEFFAEAEPCLLNAEHLAPHDVRWPYYLGHLYRLQGESAKAAAFFERTLQSNPSSVAGLIWLGNVYLDQGRLEQAEPLFGKALSLQPRLPAARLGLGRVALARRDYARAVEHLEAALAVDRRASVVRYPLAMAYRGLGQVDKAEAHLRQRGEAEIGPPDPLLQELAEALQSPVAYESRGDRALARQEFAAAADQFRKGLALAPDSLSIRHKLATALSLTNDIPGAVREYREVLRRAPEFAGAHYSLGVLLLSSGQDDLAIERFAAAVRFDPTYVEAGLQLAHALRRRGRAEASTRPYSDIVKLDPRVGEARFGYALALVRLKRYAEARDLLSDGVRMFPDRQEFVHALARLLAAAPDDRVRDGRQAVALAGGLLKGAETSDGRETMAMALAEAGRFEEAVAHQREAIAIRERTGPRDPLRQLEENLKLYESRRPCRTPWLDDPAWTNF